MELSRRSVIVKAVTLGIGGSMALSLPFKKALAIPPPDGYWPQLPSSLGKNLIPILDVGISGMTFPALLHSGAGLVLPPASDAVQIHDRRFTIKIGNSRAYQMQDGPPGNPTSGFKSRAEIDTMKIPQTHYKNGDYRIYRILFKLNKSWFFDTSIAIVCQFKPINSGPDMFVAVKRQDIVLRIGPGGGPYSSQTTIVKTVDLERWVEIVLAVNWSGSSNGKVDLYYRYADQSSLNFVTTVPGQNIQDVTRDNYLKFGIYKPDNFLPDAPLSAVQSVEIAGYAIFKDPARP